MSEAFARAAAGFAMTWAQGPEGGSFGQVLDATKRESVDRSGFRRPRVAATDPGAAGG